MTKDALVELGREREYIPYILNLMSICDGARVDCILVSGAMTSLQSALVCLMVHSTSLQQFLLDLLNNQNPNHTGLTLLHVE